jgi:NAD(P)-dependent dehydrogenase (short-subunit alcohol dehydrogenase family)
MGTVLITGTSSGFGLLATVELARRGWRVFATMRDLGRKGPLLAALDAAGVRNEVEVSRLDVTQPASVREAVTAMLFATGGRLDAVVHNAGVAAGGAFEDLPDEYVRRVLETNFFGVLDLTRAAADFPRAADRSHPHRVERSGVHGPAGQLDLLRLEVGDRGLG